MKIYFDMDGVISDWVKGFESYFGISYSDFNEMSYDKKEELKTTIELDSDFFLNLEVMKGICALNALLNAGYDIEILTSVGDKNTKEVASKKELWLDNMGLGYLPFNYTSCSKDKSKYANKDSLLIDDREKSTLPFIEAGGNAILYKDNLAELRRELLKYNIKL